MAQVVLVADDALQRRRVEQALVKADHYVLFSCDRAQLPENHHRAEADPAVWLLLLPPGSVDEVLHYLHQYSETPALILDEMPADDDEHPGWYRRMLGKLARELGEAPPLPQEPVREVWVLGASLGGPEAVKSFVIALPAGLPVALVYVQHIDECFDQVLVDNLSRYSHYRAQVCRRELHLGEGTLLVIAPDYKPRFLPFGRVIDAGERWQGPYRPCIDDVALGLARLYRERLGLIVFSGTHDDGARAARAVAAAGGTVWAQSPQDCACDAMPVAAIATGAVSLNGTPQQLAAALANRFRQHQKEKAL